MKQESKLVLGGHSYIGELGSDPEAPSGEQEAIVAECLDHGITTFDTTYQPERVALGRILERLGRRNEATIIAWNFFTPRERDFVKAGAEAYRPESLETMLAELRTDRLDMMVVHGVDDPAADAAQLELALGWKKRGLVGSLGTWWPSADTPSGPFGFMVRPWNVTQLAERPVFESGQRKGWRTYACSPFVRGWKLAELAAKAAAESRATVEEARGKLADHMLRFSACQPFVDRLIVAIRKREWVRRNLESLARGPLDPEEGAWLEVLASGG